MLRPPATAVGSLSRLPYLYVLWAVIALVAAVAIKGWTAENVTRVLVVGFLLLQFVFRSSLVRLFPGLPPRVRFVVLGTLLAAVVEGLHMISMPVFPSLRVTPDMPAARMLTHYLVDLALTVPAYLLIFAIIGRFVARYDYGFWTYTLVMGLAQTLGDGGLAYFAGSPAMLAFLPYPMTNYHAINVLPFVAVRDQLPPGRSVSPARYLVIPVVVFVYFACGALIQVVGRAAGVGPAP